MVPVFDPTRALAQLRNHLGGGRVREAIRQYEEGAQGLGDLLLSDLKLGSKKLRENTARLFWEARDFLRAGKALEWCEDWEGAAEAYEKEGGFEEAARCYEKKKMYREAARLYLKGQQVEKAFQLYQNIGDFSGAASVLEATKQLFEAARLYFRAKDYRRSAFVLGRMRASDPNYSEGILLRAASFIRMDQREQAVRCLERAMEERKGISETADAEVAYRLARLYEETALRDRALTLYEKLCDFEPEFRDVSHRHWALRKAIEEGVRPSLILNLDAQEQEALSAFSGGEAAELDTELTSFDMPELQDEPESLSSIQNMEDYETLKTLPLLASLSLEELRVLYRICEPVVFEPGEVVIEDGERSSGFFVVREGTLLVSRTGTDAHEHVIAEVSAGGSVGGNGPSGGRRFRWPSDRPRNRTGLSHSQRSF